MSKKKVLYLIYKRLRPGLGLTFGFILMYAILANGITVPLFLTAVGFLLLALYGDLYNDYWDYDEDVRNKRKDKFIIAGLITRNQSKYISFLFAAGGLLLVWFVNIFIFILALYSFILHTSYSHPRIRLKGSIKGYVAFTSIFLFLPFGLLFITAASSLLFTALFGLFYFFQGNYILCQKDSTDTKDTTNLFLKHGWEKSTRITAVFGILSSLSLLLLSFVNIYFILVWVLNVFAKIFNINKIRIKTITKVTRYRLILIEFLTPYLYLGVGLLV